MNRKKERLKANKIRPRKNQKNTRQENRTEKPTQTFGFNN